MRAPSANGPTLAAPGLGARLWSERPAGPRDPARVVARTLGRGAARGEAERRGEPSGPLARS